MYGGVAVKQSVYIVIAIVSLYATYAEIYCHQVMSNVSHLEQRVADLQARENARQAFLREYAVDAQGNWHKITVKGVR